MRGKHILCGIDLYKVFLKAAKIQKLLIRVW